MGGADSAARAVWQEAPHTVGGLVRSVLGQSPEREAAAWLEKRYRAVPEQLSAPEIAWTPGAPLRLFPVTFTFTAAVRRGRRQALATVSVRYLLDLLPPGRCFPPQCFDGAPEDAACHDERLLTAPDAPQLDALAERVRRGRPLHQPGAAAALALELGFTPVHLRLAPERRVRAALCFDSRAERVVTPDGHVGLRLLPPGTLIVNTARCRPEEEAAAILHELAHGLLEGPFRCMEVLYGCRGPVPVPIDRLERTAEQLRRCLQLPADTVLKRAETLPLPEAARTLAKDCAAVPGDVRLRMAELGLREALGVLCPIDGGVARPHRCAGAWPEDTTFAVSYMGASALYQRDERFRGVIHSGAYTYANGFFCRKDPRYVRRGRLTEYAASHVDRCCLAFREVPPEREADRPATLAGYEELNAPPAYAFLYEPLPEDDTPRAATERMKSRVQFISEADKWEKLRYELVGLTFQKAVRVVMKHQDFNQHELGLSIGMTQSAVSQHLKWDAARPDAGLLVAFGIGMRVPYFITEALLDCACIGLGNSRRDGLLRRFMGESDRLNVFACNAVLA